MVVVEAIGIAMAVVVEDEAAAEEVVVVEEVAAVVVHMEDMVADMAVAMIAGRPYSVNACFRGRGKTFLGLLLPSMINSPLTTRLHFLDCVLQLVAIDFSIF